MDVDGGFSHLPFDMLTLVPPDFERATFVPVLVARLRLQRAMRLLCIRRRLGLSSLSVADEGPHLLSAVLGGALGTRARTCSAIHFGSLRTVIRQRLSVKTSACAIQWCSWLLLCL